MRDLLSCGEKKVERVNKVCIDTNKVYQPIAKSYIDHDVFVFFGGGGGVKDNVTMTLWFPK